MPPPNIPGAAALSWFGGLTPFRDAEILSMHLNHRGPLSIRIHAWTTPPGIAGVASRVADAIVVFEFDGIRRLRLEGDEAEATGILPALTLERTAQGYRLELRPSRGIGGEIVAEEMAMRIEGG
jgi:hypothetical protein